MKNLILAAALMLGLAVTGPVAAGTITIGANTGGSPWPFTGSYLAEYQQIYDGSLFSGPVNINQITFFPAALSPNPPLIKGTFTLSLSTTSASVSNPSLVFADNLGADNALFFSGAVDNVLTFTGTPFLFDPSQGNLLLDVVAPALPQNPLSFLAAGCSTDTNRIYWRGTALIGGAPGQCTPNSFGLETQFTFTAAQVPEPSEFALFGSGLLALIGLARRRRRSQFRFYGATGG